MKSNLKSFKALQGDAIELNDFNINNISVDYISWLNDPIVLQYSNQRFITHDFISCKKYLKSFAGTDNLFLSIKTKKTNIYIGTLSVYFNINHGVADIGIMIGNKNEWGKGYGQDAWNTILSFLLKKQDVRKITAGTLACNTAMRNIIEKSGMRIEGVRNEQELINGEPQDVVLFSILNKEN